MHYKRTSCYFSQLISQQTYCDIHFNKADAKEKLAGLLFTVLSTYIVSVEKKLYSLSNQGLSTKIELQTHLNQVPTQKTQILSQKKNELETSFFRQILLMKVGLVLNHLKYTTDGNIVLQKWKKYYYTRDFSAWSTQLDNTQVEYLLKYSN